MFEVVDHVGSGTNNRKVLQQSYRIEVDSRLILLNFGRNDDAADDESVMMQDVLDFDCWLGISQLPVNAANVLDLRRFQEGQPRRGQQGTKNVIRDYLHLFQLLLRGTLQIRYLVRILAALEVGMLQSIVLFGHQSNGSEFVHPVYLVIIH